ncbi:MAG: 5'-3' exonuclease [Mycoplasmataceae bacterium]|nr:5'-3' exonuclease [Mycoplasmataceae bacterium]
MKNKILLIDGNLLLFKSFFATYYNKNKLVTTNNIDTSATHTFIMSFLKVIEITNPSHCLIAFDTGKKTKRHEIYNEYKAGRAKVPIEIFEQKKIILEILDAMNILHTDMIGYEGDDIIASVATKFSNENDIIIWSDDQDLLQLIDDNVSVIVKDYKTKKFFIKNINNFKDIHGFEHYQIPDYKAISGDLSDNLPGIKGIGPKGAKGLLSKFETLEDIYNNLNSLNETMKNKFIESKDISFMCKKLAKLELFLDIDFKLEQLKILSFANNETEKILSNYELNKIKEILKI